MKTAREFFYESISGYTDGTRFDSDDAAECIKEIDEYTAEVRTAVIEECAAFVGNCDAHKSLDVIATNMRDLLNDPENAARLRKGRQP